MYAKGKQEREACVYAMVYVCGNRREKLVCMPWCMCVETGERSLCICHGVCVWKQEREACVYAMVYVCGNRREKLVCIPWCMCVETGERELVCMPWCMCVETGERS